MSKMKKNVSDYMIPKPVGTQSSESLQVARDKMKRAGARHLPVFRGSELMGIVSERDINLALSFKHGNVATMKVEDVCTEDPFVTKPDANLKFVAHEMAERKIGSALVVDDGEVVGIFTTTDACFALSELLA